MVGNPRRKMYKDRFFPRVNTRPGRRLRVALGSQAPSEAVGLMCTRDRSTQGVSHFKLPPGIIVLWVSRWLTPEALRHGDTSIASTAGNSRAQNPKPLNP